MTAAHYRHRVKKNRAKPSSEWRYIVQRRFGQKLELLFSDQKQRYKISFNLDNKIVNIPMTVFQKILHDSIKNLVENNGNFCEYQINKEHQQAGINWCQILRKSSK